MEASLERSHIEATQGTCGGAPRIAGTRIRVSQVVLLTEAGTSPDEVVASYPHLTLADVYAALAYYHDHRDAIDDEIRTTRTTYDLAKASLGRTEGQDADSVSS